MEQPIKKSKFSYFARSRLRLRPQEIWERDYTRVIHRSKLHFAVARNIVYKSNTREKTWQVESVEHIEQYHTKFVESSSYLKRRGRKAFVESFFLKAIICITEQRFRALFFPSDKMF